MMAAPNLGIQVQPVESSKAVCLVLAPTTATGKTGPKIVLRLRLENKGPIQALHWRGAESEERTRGAAERIAGAAAAAGLVPHWGRKVLEIRPVADVDKGAATERLLEEAAAELALFGGDDRGDLDAFAALRSMAASGRLRAAVCVGVASAEAPPELSAQADSIVDGTTGFLELLRALAEPAPASGG